MRIDNKQLPDGWTVSTIENIADVNPRLNKAEIPEDLNVSFVPMPAVGAANGSIDVSGERPFIEVKKGFTAFQEGDVLFAKITPCMENGKMAIVPKVKNGLGFGSTEFHVLRPKEGVDARYIYYYVSSKNFRGEAERYMSGAVGQKRVTTPYLKESEIPVPPPEQQKRIVAEIEKQFSRLDEAVGNLKRVKDNLKRYKAAVLKAAVEGKLTEEWRKQHPDVEPASTLLEHILAERRQKWEEAELAKMKAKGKVPKDAGWKKKYKEPNHPEVAGMPDIPENWKWATFEQISDRVTVGHVGSMKNEYIEKGIPFLRSQNVRENRYDPGGLKYVSSEFHEKLAKSALQPGDMVVVRSGSVGISCVIPVTLNEANCSDLIIVKQPNGILPEYGAYYMNSIVHTRVASQKVGVALTHFNTKSMAAMPVPVPSVKEQRRIVDEVSKRLSVTDEVENELDANLQRAERLRQSILSKAFSGGFLTSLA